MSPLCNHPSCFDCEHCAGYDTEVLHEVVHQPMPATKATQDVLTDLFHTNQNKQREMSEEIGRLKNENNNLREQIINLKRTNKKSNNKKRAHK